LTGFAAGFSGPFEVLATAANVATFTQQVGGASLSVDTFSSSSPVTPTTTPVTSSLDVSGFSGLADLWERRDRIINCSTIPAFTLAAAENKEVENEQFLAKNCSPASPFEAPNRLIDETAIDEAAASNLPAKPHSLTEVDAEMGPETTTSIPTTSIPTTSIPTTSIPTTSIPGEEAETPVVSTALSNDIAVNDLDTAVLATFIEEAYVPIESLDVGLPDDFNEAD